MKKLFTFICVALCSIALHANVVTGTCGDNLTWSYDTETQALTIEGTGAMTDYVSDGYWNPDDEEEPLIVAPWSFVRSNITSLSLPEGLTSIGTCAFWNCTNLTSVTIPNTVTTIGNSAFSDCPLYTITIPNSVTSIGSYAFYYNNAITSVTIGSGVTEIGEDAFGYESFYGNRLVKTNYTGDLAGWCAIRFADSYANPAVRSKNLYLNDELVTDATIPANVIKIGNYAFCNNTSLHTISIPNGVDSIGVATFYGCTWLTNLVLPESITSIGQRAFVGCNMDSVTIPSNLTRIEAYSFADCPALRYVNIPEGVTTINSCAFDNCSDLTSVTIPSTVTEIGEYAFSSCKQVYLKSMTPPTIKSNTFKSDAKICVLCSALSAYNEADIWQYMNLYGLSYPLDLSATPGGYAYVLYSDCDNNIATIYAASNNTYYYKFSQWSDGNTENPRTLALTEDTKLTADFTAVPFHKVVLKGYSIEGDIQYVDYNSNSVYTYDFWGNTTKNVLEGMQVIISENGSCGNWLGWSDGNTEKYDRIITITSDTVIESLFDAKSYEISITAGEGGYLSNGDFEGKIYDCDNYISRRAYPYDGYYFVGWSNGETDTYLSMDIYSDTIVVALFAEIVPASVVVAPTAACASMGTVSGGGAYNTGDYVTITATPNEGYHFVEWSDGNGRPERTFRLISDTTLYATFAAGDFGGKCGTDLYWTWDKTTKELSITGTGAMDLETYPAWKSDTYRARIDTLCRIQFADGITTIAENAFTTIDYNYPTYLVKELIIPASVGFMGYGCFRGFGGSMDRIEYLGNTAKVDGWAMAGKKVRYLKVPAGFVSELDIQDTLIITNGEASMSYSTCPYVDLSAASNTDMSRIAITYHSDVLRTYILPNDLEVIDDNALRSCRYLSAITIPAGVTYIGVSAFEDCRSMTSVTFAGNKVETIGDWAFYNCHSLRNLTLPEGVEEVGLAAFYGCTYLNELTIPSTMKKIADNGFAGCEKMQTMYVNALVPPTIEAKTFEDVNRATPVFVPRGTMELYQADQYWSEFFNMAEYDAPTGNLGISADETNGLRKVVRDGQVLILRGDKVYTILGEQL